MFSQTHPDRIALHNEVHARPYDALPVPCRVLHWAYSTIDCDVQDVVDHVRRLMSVHHLPLPDVNTSQVSIDLPACRLRWERHSEFVTYTAWQTGEHAIALADALPADWLQSAVGQLVCAIALDTVCGESNVHIDKHAVKSKVAGADVTIESDYHLAGDGFSQWRVWIQDPKIISPDRVGRVVQQLLEIETYRMMGLLGLPAARLVGFQLKQLELDLMAISVAIDTAQKDQEPALLEKLTRLASQLESLYATHHARFSATSAYMDLVQQRLTSLDEQVFGEHPSLASFLARRLTPAAQTCAWTVRRLQALSERVSRNCNLLRTRVEVEQQEHHKRLLATMTARQLSQLQLQAAVEGLSAVALTYYAAGITGYLSRALQPLGWPLSNELTVALSIPLVFVSVLWGMHRMKKHMSLFEIEQNK